MVGSQGFEADMEDCSVRSPGEGRPK
jgi:hypothetical protein